jgi:hypothetical protein
MFSSANITDNFQRSIYILVSEIMVAASIIMMVPFLLLGSIVWLDRRTIANNVRNALREMTRPQDAESIKRPAYLLINSIDREVLQTISQTGGDLAQTEYALHREVLIKNTGDLQNSITKLIFMGLVTEPTKFPYYRVFITARGLDALNTPGTLFVSDIPTGIWQYVYQMKSKIWQKEWSGAAIAMGNALQMMLVHMIELAKENNPPRWSQVLEEYSKASEKYKRRPLMEWALGDLKGALRKMEIIRKQTFEDMIIGELIALRNKVHPPDQGIRPHPFLPREAAMMDLYLDIILQLWFGPQ